MAKIVVPTTEQVYEAFASEGDGGIASLSDHSWEAFDAWLNQIRAEAWDRACWHAAPSGNLARVWQEQNPYRAEEES